MLLTVTTLVRAPLSVVWEAYVTPADIMAWNAASDDWHCPDAVVDLRVGGAFRSRMAARDGSMAFDFEGAYTAVEPQRRLAYRFGEREAEVAFEPGPEGVTVRVRFEPETTYPIEQQQGGWQAILDRFARHVEAGRPGA
jgi:uncharacterized protein YndB with AHSA1/START domain